MARVHSSERCRACHAYLSAVFVVMGACTTLTFASPKSSFEIYGKLKLSCHIALLHCLSEFVTIGFCDLLFVNVLAMPGSTATVSQSLLDFFVTYQIL